MQVVFSDSCVILSQLDATDKIEIQAFLDNKLDLSEIPIVRNIVLYRFSEESSAKALLKAQKQYAPPDFQPSITDDSDYVAAAQTVCYYVDGKPVVDIYFPELYLCDIIHYFSNPYETGGQDAFLGLQAFHMLAHETGHALFFQIGGEKVILSSQLSAITIKTSNDLKQYIYYEGKTLLSEYAAESRANTYIKLNDYPNLVEIWRTISDNCENKNFIKVLSLSYRLLYYASFHYSYSENYLEDCKEIPLQVIEYLKEFNALLNQSHGVFSESIARGIGEVMYKIGEYLIQHKQ